MGLREEKKERMRVELYETAIELFRTHGFDTTRVRDVIAAVGVSEPTFFNYFQTKEAVLDEFAARTLDEIAQRLQATLDSASSIDTRIRFLMAILADVFSSDAQFMAVIATRSGLFWGPRGGTLERQLDIYKMLTKLLKEAQRRGEIRVELDPQLLAETITGASMLTIVNWLPDWWEQPGDLAGRLDQQADVLLSGCRTPSE